MPADLNSLPNSVNLISSLTTAAMPIYFMSVTPRPRLGSMAAAPVPAKIGRVSMSELSDIDDHGRERFATLI
jgi:hypothetical protein